MKIATWNVNGIRARQAQVQEWIERERPDVVCLQEIKAASDQIPTALCEMEGYWCYWHGGKGYSGVGLHVSQAFAPERPAFSHPAFDYENRIVTVDDRRRRRDGRVDLRAERRQGLPAKMRFLEALDDYAASFQARGRPLVLCGDLNVARTERDVHPKERKPRAIGQLPEERALIERIIAPRPRRRRPRARSRQRRPVHLVGAVAQHAPAQHRLAARLRPRQRGARSAASIACPVQKDVGTSDHAPVVATFAEAMLGHHEGSKHHEGHEDLSAKVASCLRDLRAS